MFALLILLILMIGYALTRVGAHMVFRPQKKRWPLKLPFQKIAFPRLTAK